MHRNERIARALQTLTAIETAIAVSLYGAESASDIAGANVALFTRDVNNAVRLYCASEIARAMPTAP